MISKTEVRRHPAVKLALAVLLAGALCLVGAILAVSTSPRVLATLLGLRPLGPLAAVLPSESARLTLDGEPLDYIDVLLRPQDVEPVTVDSSRSAEGSTLSHSFIGDASTPGTTSYLLNLDEEDANDLLREFVLPTSSHTDRYHNVAIDLQPGGLVVYADVDLGIHRQRIGLLLLQDPKTLTLSPAGVVLDGQLYAMPETGSLARLLVPTGRQAQHTIYALTIVGPLQGEAEVDVTRFGPDSLQILARATYDVSSAADTGWQAVERGLELREIDIGARAGRLGERLSIVRFDPGVFRIRVHYDPYQPKTISGWGTALNAVLLVNGSYFAPESDERHETIGLLISDGQRWGTLLHDYAGMLAVTSTGEVSVRWLRHQPYDPAEPLDQAMQSFPVLVKPGGVIGFPDDADDGAPARRTVVAQDGEENILLLVAPRGTLSLHELAVFLADSDLGIDVALNLDGGGSTGLWLSVADAQVEIDSITPVPSVIAVERR